MNPSTQPARAVWPKALIVVLVAGLIAAFFVFDGGQYLTLERLKASRATLSAWVDTHFALALASYMTVYIIITAASLPGAAIMTLAGGALFGLFWGLIAVSFASSIGATLAFLATRLVFGDAVRRKFADRLKGFEEGVRKDGAWYLLSLRMVPLVPFFVVNVLMGLTPIAARTFYWVSQLGMLPGTIAFVYAGTQLARINHLKDVVSPNLLIAFAIIGLLPLLLKQVLNKLQASRNEHRG